MNFCRGGSNFPAEGLTGRLLSSELVAPPTETGKEDGGQLRPLGGEDKLGRNAETTAPRHTFRRLCAIDDTAVFSPASCRTLIEAIQ